MMPYIDVPERCEECERLEAAKTRAEAVYDAYPVLDKKNNRLKLSAEIQSGQLTAHRRVCRVWQASHV